MVWIVCDDAVFNATSRRYTGAYAGGVQGVQVNPPFFKLIIFIEWLGMHV